MPKKKKTEPVHHVTGKLNVVEFTKAGSALELEIYERKRKLGTIVIGRGSFSWRGSNRRNGYWWNWTLFAEIMNREAYKE